VYNPYEKYQKIQLETASQGRLILALYDGAIRFLKQAIDGINQKKLDVANNNLVRTQNILTELMVSLNMDVGEIAHNLYSIYDYMNYRLVQANIKKDISIINEILGLLTDLRDTWEIAIKKTGEKLPQQDKIQRTG
jgi:flagellar protein FliS